MNHPRFYNRAYIKAKKQSNAFVEPIAKIIHLGISRVPLA